MDKQRLTDAETKKLLERASELDAQHAQTLDIATFREIATEAGISPAAVDAALQESATPQQVVATQPGPLRLTLRIIGRVALGLAIAFIVLFIMRAFP